MRRQRNESRENNFEDDFSSEETRRHFARREQERRKEEDRRDHSTREPHWEGDYGNLTGRNLKNNKRSDERRR